MGFLSNAEQMTALVAKLILEGLAAGTFIYVACVEMLAHEIQHEHSSAGFFKGLSVCLGAFAFFAFNYLLQ